jgi:hypothetical protein
MAAGLLESGDQLTMTYGPRGVDRQQFEAKVLPDGSIEVLGKSFSAPSYAALLCVQAAGSNRNTVNGWISWKTSSGKTLADLRESLLRSPPAQETIG